MTTKEIIIRKAPLSRRVRNAIPYLLLITMFLTFFGLPAIVGRHTSVFNLFNAFQLWSAYGLVALAVGLTMIAGEFDFGVLGVFALCPMIAVKVGIHGWFLGLFIALLIALAVGFLEGLLVTRLRMNSLPITLGFYIALLGATKAIGNSQSVSFSNLNVGRAFDAVKFEIFSWRSIIAILIFLTVTAIMRYTAVGREVRAIGGDRRASRTVGVKVDKVLIGMFMTSSVCSALGGILLAYSFSTALADPGMNPLTFAVTASLIGGVSLVGGIGSSLGIAAGALTLCLLQELFSILASPTYTSSLVTGTLLVLATIVAAPEIASQWHSWRVPKVVVSTRRNL